MHACVLIDCDIPGRGLFSMEAMPPVVDRKLRTECFCDTARDFLTNVSSPRADIGETKRVIVDS